MNRLPFEIHRLFVPHVNGDPVADPDDASLVGADGQVRAMVLELARPADWKALSKVWHGVQADLGLPAPAIAVSGKDGYQLWFSLAAPVPVPQAAAFLDALRLRYLGDIKPHRLALLPTLDAGSAQQALHARMVPAIQAGTGLWSAFIAPDLAPVFAEEPWLDLPPNLDGQASLLARLDSMQALDFQQALARLGPPVLPARSQPATGPDQLSGCDVGPPAMRPAPLRRWRDPKDFLLDIINDDSVALALRIDAARALLPYVGAPSDP